MPEERTYIEYRQTSSGGPFKVTDIQLAKPMTTTDVRHQNVYCERRRDSAYEQAYV